MNPFISLSPHHPTTTQEIIRYIILIKVISKPEKSHSFAKTPRIQRVLAQKAPKHTFPSKELSLFIET